MNLTPGLQTTPKPLTSAAGEVSGSSKVSEVLGGLQAERKVQVQARCKVQGVEVAGVPEVGWCRRNG